MHTKFRKGSSCSVATLKNKAGNNVLCKEAVFFSAMNFGRSFSHDYYWFFLLLLLNTSK